MQGLQEAGWAVSRNARIDIRWGEDDVDRERKYAAELVARAPDVILAGGTLGMAALQQASRSVPIVFVHVTDPVGAGFVDSLASPPHRPRRGNAHASLFSSAYCKQLSGPSSGPNSLISLNSPIPSLK
jgi:hypothetical protein